MRRAIQILFLALLVSTSLAQPKQQRRVDDFLIKNDVIVVDKNSTMQNCNDIASILTNNGIGCKVASPFISFKQKIVPEKVITIAGVAYADALQITVTPRKITIKYTSDKAFNNALNYLREMISGRRIEGRNITDWSETMGLKGGFFDASSELLPMEQVERAINKNKDNDLYIRVVDNNNWRLWCETFEMANPAVKPIAASSVYDREILRDLLVKNRRAVLMVDLITPNKIFEQTTGHSQFSVEGMRFVRAIVEEYVDKLKIKRICLGATSDKIDKRFADFLKFLERENSIEIIIL
ncbi:hypothetical protein BN938_0873 [Mucinivorans hirudinis]|uniref:Uncharacterized protein n=1 Tax=Mucinivorans hirudinis TaxID=1433126 RepID=A0A060RB19_9BACT|nr:hypothetical protein BN938_0873 [Mucinivorans hirudinis]